MTLSLSKLENLMSANGFIPTMFFTLDNICVYIQVMSVVNTEMFLLYIPSKYEFSVGKKSNIPSFEIKYIDLENKDNIADDYAGEQDENIENIYKEIDTESPTKNNSIGSQLEENYRRKIALGDSIQDNIKQVRNNARQLKRLRLCVQNVRYKIGILYKNFLCAIKKDDSIECYNVKRYNNSKDSKQLYVIVDLELFYEKMSSLLSNISTIRQGIYDILNTNRYSNLSTFQSFLEENKDSILSPKIASMKAIEYEKHLKEATDMLNITISREKIVLENIYNINTKYNTSVKSLNTDIEKAHLLTKYNNELTDIQKIKEDIIKILIELTEKYQNIILTTDNTMFDNNVMIECIIKNFSELNKICN